MRDDPRTLEESINRSTQLVADLFRPKADPVVVGLFLNSVMCIRDYPHTGDLFSESEYDLDSVHTPEVKRPISYVLDNIDRPIASFVQGLIQAADPDGSITIQTTGSDHWQFTNDDNIWYRCSVDDQYLTVVVAYNSWEVDSDHTTDDDEDWCEP